MGLGGISIWQLLIILAIIVMVFGTSRLRNLGGDLGSAIKGFRNSMSKDESDSDESNPASREESDSDKPAT
jgi:sec-independent protein translocase protein TatA